MRRTHRSAALIAITLLNGGPALAASGDPDPTFGTDGVVATNFGAHNAIGTSVVRQPDGKLVAAGVARFGKGVAGAFAAIRVDAAGVPDAGFGAAGEATTEIGPHEDSVAQVLVQADGKVVLVGTTALDGGGTDTDVALVRYHPDGTLDGTFGTGGVVVTSLGLGRDDAQAAALQADGKLVVVASMAAPGAPPGTGSGSDLVVLRYDTAGALDGTFGIGGAAQLDFGGRTDAPSAVLVQPDDTIVVAGSSFDGPLFFDGGIAPLVRLDSTGALDPGFGTGGVVEIADATTTYSYAMLRQPDGKLVVLVGAATGLFPTLYLKRYDATGAPDPSMTEDPLQVAPFSFNPGSLALQADGRFVVTGQAGGGVIVARVNHDGSADASFGQGGVTSLGVGSFAMAAVAEPGGRTVVTGSRGGSGGKADLIVARIDGASADCVVDADCGVCERCGGGGLCEVGPRAGCAPATSGLGKVKVKSMGLRSSVVFQWRGVTVPAFDPVAADDVGLCLHDLGLRRLKTVAPAGGLCRGVPCWSGALATKLKYKDRDGTPDGIAAIVGQSDRVKVVAKGPELATSTHGVPSSLGLLAPLVQLHAGNGACVEATFSDPAKIKVTPTVFRAKSD